MSYRVKKNDNVIVLTGRDKKKTGRVIYVDPASNFVKVENINMVTRHKKARSAQEQGGISKMEGNIHISNVQIVCPACSQPTRIAASLDGDKKTRVCKKCGAGLEVKAEKAKKAKKEKAVEKAEKATKSTDSRVKRSRKPKTEDKTEETQDSVDNQ